MPTKKFIARQPSLPRPWLPLDKGTVIGTSTSFPAPNPLSINWPSAQLANPSVVGSSIKFKPLPPVPKRERQTQSGITWPSAQFISASDAYNISHSEAYKKYLGDAGSEASLESNPSVAQKTVTPLLIFGISVLGYIMVAKKTLAP